MVSEADEAAGLTPGNEENEADRCFSPEKPCLPLSIEGKLDGCFSGKWGIPTMSLMEIFLIGIGLSMDAFAVAICKGLSMQKVDLRYTVWIALYFGVFQAAMPLTGWLLGSQFARHVTRFAPWIAFILLALIGGNMIRESLSKDEEEAEREEGLTVDHKELLMLAVATSIDALAVGVSFSMVEISISIGAAVILIGCTTFVISLAGVFIGNAFGAKYEKRAEFVGGAILILIGLKILLEHFGVL